MFKLIIGLLLGWGACEAHHKVKSMTPEQRQQLSATIANKADALVTKVGGAV